MVDVIRDEAGAWSVERALRTNVATPQETINGLDPAVFADTPALSAELPRLVNELLQLAPGA